MIANNMKYSNFKFVRRVGNKNKKNKNKIFYMFMIIKKISISQTICKI